MSRVDKGQPYRHDRITGVIDARAPIKDYATTIGVATIHPGNLRRLAFSSQTEGEAGRQDACGIEGSGWMPAVQCRCAPKRECVISGAGQAVAHRRRLYKSLFYLAASMAGAALFLNWAKPSQGRTQQNLEREWLAQARSVVDNSTADGPPHWEAIEVVAGNSAATSAPDAARARSGDFHFVVDPLGRLASEPSWRRITSANVPATVRINVLPPPDNRNMSLRQWLSLGALINALNELGTRPTDLTPLRVRYHGLDMSGLNSPDWQAPAGAVGLDLP